MNGKKALSGKDDFVLVAPTRVMQQNTILRLPFYQICQQSLGIYIISRLP